MAEYNTVLCEIAEKMNAVHWCMSLYAGHEDNAAVIDTLSSLYEYIWCTEGVLGTIRNSDGVLFTSVLSGAERVLGNLEAVGMGEVMLAKILRGLCREMKFDLEFRMI